ARHEGGVPRPRAGPVVPVAQAARHQQVHNDRGQHLPVLPLPAGLAPPRERRICRVQEAYSPTTTHSLFRSMLPPETTHTTLPPPAWPASPHATGQAPAPSAMTRLPSASNRMAAATSARPATKAPSISCRARWSISGKTVLLPIPSTNEGW